MTTTASQADALPIRKGSERSLLDYKWHIGLYSLSGGGKTYLIGTAGKTDFLSPVLLVDFEDGSVTIDTNGFPNVDIISVEEYKQTIKKNTGRDISYWKAVLELMSHIEKMSKQEDFPYKLVGFDGLSRVQDWCDDAIIQEAISKKAEQGNHDPELASLADYRRVASRMGELFWRIRSLPVHTIATAKQRLTESEDSTPSYRMYEAHPNFYPKTMDEFEGCFDVIARLRRELQGTKEVTLLETRLSSKFLAKSRGKLEGRMEDPSAEKVFSQLVGGAKAQS